jgi:hypothetical protein
MGLSMSAVFSATVGSKISYYYAALGLEALFFEHAVVQQ